MRSLLCLLAAACFAQQPPEYIFGFLRAHPERADIPKEQADEIQKAHMGHLGKMSQAGFLIAAGPLANSPDLRGVLIFRGIDLEGARKLAAEDPAVINKRLVVDVAPWPGPPGVGAAIAARLKEDPKAQFEMTRRALVVYWKGAGWPLKLGAPENKPTLSEHMAWMEKLQASGNVYAVAPLIGSKDFVGVAVYKTADPAEALKICSEDPMVKAGWVRAQAFVWFHAADTFAKP